MVKFQKGTFKSFGFVLDRFDVSFELRAKRNVCADCILQGVWACIFLEVPLSCLVVSL